MPTLTIDYRTFLKGLSRSEDYADGGFNPDSRVEVDRGLTNFGLLTSGRLLTENSTNINSIVYSTTIGKLGSDGVGLYGISSNGKIYYRDSSHLSNHSVKYTESVKSYTTNSHCIIYNNSIFITSTTDIYKDDGTFSVNDHDWWTTTLSKTALTADVPHKMFIFQGNLYILNGNKIASWNGITAVDAALTLPTGWVIVDVAVGNSEILLLATKNYVGNDVNGDNKIFVWDSLTLTTWSREIELLTNTVHSLVKAELGYYFFTKGFIYFTDGYSYKLVKRNDYILTNFNKVKFNNDIIYIVSTYGVMSYNTKLNIITIPITYLQTGSNFATHLNIISGDIVDLYTSESGTGKHYYAAANTAETYFKSNKYDFGQPVIIKQIEVLFKSNLGSTNQCDTYLFNTTGVSTQVLIDNTNARHTGKIKIVENVNFRVDLFYFSATFRGSLPAIRYFKFHYEPSERNTTF